MRHLSPAVLALAFGAACATGGKPGGSETTVAPATTGIIVGSASMASMNISTNNAYTAIATPLSVSPDSAYALLTRAYVMLEIPVVPVDQKRAIGNDALSIRRRIASIPMQKVVDCGEKMGLENAETWDIHMNILSYVEALPDGKSQILTRIQAMGNPPDLSNRDLSPCSSFGELEKKISDLVVKLASNK
ncbi:MAG TPA: hypothetical protein VGI97_06500 [Gemmatimonadaceae bacterium]|jgi:hypothetical protein